MYGKNTPQSPLNIGFDGNRPAGNIIQHESRIYRLAQNCSQYYGENISVFKITELTPIKYNEMYVKDVEIADNTFKCLHTLNIGVEYVVFDYIR